eukprot:5899864-Karenia_brevis.AAC.1
MLKYESKASKNLKYAGLVCNSNTAESREVKTTECQEKKLTGVDAWTNTKVYSLLCADDTAPIQVTLWSQGANGFE